METEQQRELAVKAPMTIPETAAETELRERSKQLYYQTNQHGTYHPYDAGWKAAKAYYENRK